MAKGARASGTQRVHARTAYERPEYATYVLNEELADIEGQHLVESPVWLRERYEHAMRNELVAMRAAEDGRRTADEFWYREGYRAITEAWRAEWQLAMFRTSLSGALYVSQDRDLSPKIFYVYHQDDTAPSGVRLAETHEACKEAEALVVASRRGMLATDFGGRS